MKKKILPTLVAILGLFTSSVLSAAVLYQDTFENRTLGADLKNVSTSDANAKWQGDAAWGTKASNNSNAVGLGSVLGARFVNADNTRYAFIDYDLDAVESYTVDIGYLDFNGLNGNFGVSARASTIGTSSNSGSSISDAKNYYLFTKTTHPQDSAANIRVSYINTDGSADVIGTILAPASSANYTAYLTNISILVTGSTQQLFVNGSVFDATARTTGGTFNNGSPDYLAFYASAPSGNSAAISFDNIIVTQIPESSNAAIFTGIGAVTLISVARRRR